MATWQEEYPRNPPLTISVNISGLHLSRPGLAEEVQSVLETCGLKPEQLHIEITESAIMQHAQSTVTLLTDLQQLGVKLYIDDFGIGYSSLSYLHQFPLDAIKIDRSFINNMQQNEKLSELVSTIIKLAHTLNMKVIAEGVETSNQRFSLESMKCEEAQGFHFAKPMEKTKIETLFLRNTSAKEIPG
jgi:EAL domain-containing protein (putative c-di-GMP-specific phosphodiesterase class I)